MSKKIAINACYGGFGLSKECVKAYTQKKGMDVWVIEGNSFLTPTYSLVPPEERIDADYADSYSPKEWHIWTQEERAEWNKKYSEQTFSPGDLKRDDPVLIEVIEELGSEVCSGDYASIRIVEIPDDVSWHIEEYDGNEWVAEDHRVWD